MEESDNSRRVKFVISPSGSVSEAGIVSSSMKSATVDNCVVDVIKSLRFPEPQGGGLVTVTKPFSFRMAGR